MGGDVELNKRSQAHIRKNWLSSRLKHGILLQPNTIDSYTIYNSSIVVNRRTTISTIMLPQYIVSASSGTSLSPMQATGWVKHREITLFSGQYLGHDTENRDGASAYEPHDFSARVLTKILSPRGREFI